jgi:hypothetical protein
VSAPQYYFGEQTPIGVRVGLLQKREFEFLTPTGYTTWSRVAYGLFTRVLVIQARLGNFIPIHGLSQPDYLTS